MKMYHDAFSATSHQPKIPDGKVGESLGFSTQNVIELVQEDQPFTPTANMMHLLLVPGQNYGLIAHNTTESASWNADGPITGSGFGNYTYGFQKSGGAQFVTPIANQDVIVQNAEDYSYWRVVSQALKLSLLNNDEENDGWWEAVRITDPISTENWCLTTANNSDTINDGVCAPYKELDSLTTRSLANEPSYNTGLLRDIHNVEFHLHPVKDEHDFERIMDPLRLRDSDSATGANRDVDIANELLTNNGGQFRALPFKSGSQAASKLIAQQTDQSHDMIYIRIHCRVPPEGQGNNGKTRLHCNIVSNQEICFDSTATMSRYQTKSEKAVNMEKQAHRKKASQDAAHTIMDTGGRRRRVRS
jgi:hypothetical protein